MKDARDGFLPSFASSALLSVLIFFPTVFSLRLVLEEGWIVRSKTLSVAQQTEKEISNCEGGLCVNCLSFRGRKRVHGTHFPKSRSKLTFRQSL